jgi:hypothetical protein
VSGRTVRIELTLAEAEALFNYAVEGREDAGARGAVRDGGEHPSTAAAGHRAIRKFATAIVAVRGTTP